VSVQIDTAGRAAVRVGGTTGPVLVSGKEAATVAISRTADGDLAFTIQRGREQEGFVPTGGAFAGMAEGDARIRDARASLNDVAQQFVDTVNDVLVQGDDLAGNDGQRLFTVGTPASELSLAFTDGALIAAAGRDGGPRDASNLIALQTARTGGKVEEAGTQLIAGVASAIESRGTVTEAQNAIRDAAIAALDARAGVDLDQEAVDLIRFQQAYQASSRVIQVARETMQTLLDIR
jgi:flagellar hook-associated protein FlgK